MAGYTWEVPRSGDWITVADWSPAAVPDDVTANVTIDNPTLAPYFVTTGTGEAWTVNSLTMNAVNDQAGSNTAAYTAAALVINGTLDFGAGSPGTLGGSLQTLVFINNGTILNPGTLNAYIQGQGNVLLTGTNGIYITNWLEASGGVITVDTRSIAELTGQTLFDGIFEAAGLGGVVNLGGPRQAEIVNIQTIEGPPANPSGWTELTLNGTLTDIGEWNGKGYVGIESTLTDIAERGTVDVLGGRNYSTTNALSVQPTGLLNLRAGTVTTDGIDINGGTVQGSGEINSGVINNGTLRALDGILTVGTGGLVGTGLVTFDYDQQAGTVSATGATMQVFGVGPGQTFVMNGDDTLVISTPASFAGTIDAKAGDSFILGGVIATNAVLQGTTLLVEDNGKPTDAVHLGGSYTGDTFAVSSFGTTNSEIKVVGATAAASAAGDATAATTAAVGGTAATVNPTTAAMSNAFTVTDFTTGTTIASGGNSYTGPVNGPISDFSTVTADSLNVTANNSNVFISVSGGGNDSINASLAGGNNVLSGGSGSFFMTGGPGDDTFLINASVQTSNSLSTLVNFHSGDTATILGVTPSDFAVSLSNNAGAPGYTGLDFTFSAPGKPSVGVILVGYSTTDLTNGRLAQAFGTIDGTPYLTIRAT